MNVGLLNKIYLKCTRIENDIACYSGEQDVFPKASCYFTFMILRWPQVEYLQEDNLGAFLLILLTEMKWSPCSGDRDIVRKWRYLS